MKYENLEPYSKEEFTELVFSIIKETARENPERIKVGWTDFSSIPADIGKLDYILACEREIDDEEESLRNLEHVTIILHDCRVSYRTDEGFRKLEDVISDLKKEDGYEIIVCVQVLKQVDDGLFLAKLFDHLFIIETYTILRFGERTHVFLIARHDTDPEVVDVTFFKISRKEALLMLA